MKTGRQAIGGQHLGPQFSHAAGNIELPGDVWCAIISMAC
jgi:hypothetical protein